MVPGRPATGPEADRPSGAPVPQGWPPPPPTGPPFTPWPGTARRRRWPVVLGSVGSVVFVLAVAAAFVHLPYDSIGPGWARPVDELVRVEGHPTYPARGTVLFATVSSRQGVNPYEALVGWLDSTVDVLPQKTVRGDLPAEEYRRLNVEAMADSKTAAEIVALRYLGITNLGVGAQVVEVEPGSPAAAILKPGDVVVAIDGRPVATSGDAVAAIRARRAGETIALRVGGGSQRDALVELARAHDGGPFLGVRLTTRIKLPFDIFIDSGDVVGPSAGLAYALELLDVLTPGELTGGAAVAATGDLGPNGEVRPVGGVAHKAAAVERAGAKLFLVPKDNEAEARSKVKGRLTVVGVSNFEEALKALGELAGSNAPGLVAGQARPAA